jgi:putative SOS response-associated peptidase YedK
MCSRYILSTTFEAIETKFGLPPQAITFQPNFNISPGQNVPVITNEKPHEIQFFKFGLTPFCAKSQMNLFNARAEGDSNSEDNPTFRGAAGIIQKKAFRKPIRSQRCIVIASAFIEITSDNGISKAYLVYLRNHQNPFALAGIWDTWLNPSTGFPENAFSIITTTANSLLRQIGNHRMPVILTDSEAKRWIKSGTELLRITAMLKHYDSKLMNAYPIDPKIKNPLENDKQLIQPTGPRLLTEEKRVAFQIPKGSGYHEARKANKAADISTMAERLELAKKKETEIKENQLPTQSQYIKYE